MKRGIAVRKSSWRNRHLGSAICFRKTPQADYDAIKRIWEDMRGFAGYLGHELLIEHDNPAHVIVISRWESREAADRVREEYRNHPNAIEADRLAADPRRRVVAISRQQFRRSRKPDPATNSTTSASLSAPPLVPPSD